MSVYVHYFYEYDYVSICIYMYLRRCCCVQSRYRELVGVVNREDDPLVSMVEVHEQLPPQ